MQVGVMQLSLRPFDWDGKTVDIPGDGFSFAVTPRLIWGAMKYKLGAAANPYHQFLAATSLQGGLREQCLRVCPWVPVDPRGFAWCGRGQQAPCQQLRNSES